MQVDDRRRRETDGLGGRRAEVCVIAWPETSAHRSRDRVYQLRPRAIVDD